MPMPMPMLMPMPMPLPMHIIHLQGGRGAVLCVLCVVWGTVCCFGCYVLCGAVWCGVVCGVWCVVCVQRYLILCGTV
jgi:hypothetical protein